MSSTTLGRRALAGAVHGPATCFPVRSATLIDQTAALVLAGGRGERLQPLTGHRPKAMVPFGGCFRLIDFTLTNCGHSQVPITWVIAQHLAEPLRRHLRDAWGNARQPRGVLPPALLPPPPGQTGGYRGTADAIRKHLSQLEGTGKRWALVLACDQVYRMDYRRLLEAHVERRAELTVACLPVDVGRARELGTVAVDAASRIVRFEEKAAQPLALPGRPDQALASMGIYVFDVDVLAEVLRRGDGREDGCDDFGRHILPQMVRQGRAVYAHDAAGGEPDRPFYWTDVGLIDRYWSASMDLVSASPEVDLWDPYWSAFAHPAWQFPVCCRSHGSSGSAVSDAILGLGATVEGAAVGRAVLSAGVSVGPGAAIDEAVVMDGCQVGPGARVRRAILDQGVIVAAGAQVGMDPTEDRSRFHVTPGGVVVVPRGTEVRPRRPATGNCHSYAGCGREWLG